MYNEKLRVGIAGLGRMGKRHAANFVITPRVIVVAASTPDDKEHEWAAENLEGVKTYHDYEGMLDNEDLHAVVIASVTAVHVEQALKAIERGLHVLCEKPLSIDAEVVSEQPSPDTIYIAIEPVFMLTSVLILKAQSVVGAYNRSLQTYPDQKVMCGFSRRFDASYREAHARMAQGTYGQPVLFRSQTADLYDPSGFFVEYAKTSGGIFVDCSIHDIDLLLWFFGEDCRIKSLQAVGVAAVHPALESSNDRDNAIATVEFFGGRIATLFCSRMMAAGQEDTTEIICTEGSLRVNLQGRRNHVETHDSTGVRRELPQHYYERFREAFVTEAKEFTESCLDNKPPPISLQSSVKAVAIGQALQRSLITGKKLFFSEKELN